LIEAASLDVKFGGEFLEGWKAGDPQISPGTLARAHRDPLSGSEIESGEVKS
jgi:hypothetical protein